MPTILRIGPYRFYFYSNEKGEPPHIHVHGRKIVVPLVWFPRLLNATKDQLENYEILGDGEGIHWPDIDEDLSVAGLLSGSH